MTELILQKCKACEAGIPPMKESEILMHLQNIKNWHLDVDKKLIKKELSFKNFYQTMAFVNAIAWIAHKENHHPDLSIGYNYCHISLTTHALDGLSLNDFIMAAKIDLIEKA